MIASPDGRTLYCNAGGLIWAQPVQGGAARLVRAGSAVAIDPKDQYLAVIEEQQGHTRLLKVPLDGSSEQEVPISGDARPYILETGSISKDGKLLMGLQPPDSWFLEPAVIDLATGRATRIPIDVRGDSFNMAWTPDGQILAAVTGLESSLWKFQMAGAAVTPPLTLSAGLRDLGRQGGPVSGMMHVRGKAGARRRIQTRQRFNEVVKTGSPGFIPQGK
jgi:hypothetical protein